MRKHSSPTDKFNSANQNFKKVYNEGLQREKNGFPNKYKWLPSWTLNKSRYLLRESENEQEYYQRNKKVYKRGAIVNVDFGVNVGQELSGNHFAIILNKHDNKLNDKLTVIPLTSHKHQYSIKLDQTILNLSQTSLQLSLNTMIITYYCNSLLLVNFLFPDKDLILLAKQAIFNPKKFIKLISQKFPNNASSSTNVSTLPDEIITQINKLIDSSNIKNVEDAKSFLYKINQNSIKTNDISSITDSFNNTKLMFESITTVFEKYSSYNKETWAKINDIQTISKLRLRKINKYDPIGDIKVTPEVLNKIDKSILKIFTC